MHLCECKDWTVVVGACVQGPVFGQCNTVHAGRRLVLTYVEQEWWAKLVIEEEQKSKGTCSSDRAANSNFWFDCRPLPVVRSRANYVLCLSGMVKEPANWIGHIKARTTEKRLHCAVDWWNEPRDQCAWIPNGRCRLQLNWALQRLLQLSGCWWCNGWGRQSLLPFLLKCSLWRDLVIRKAGRLLLSRLKS